MYLHLGADVCVRTRDIVCIMDMETSSTSPKTREFLKKNQKTDRVISVSDELPKSYVVIHNQSGITVYISPISSQTLLKRANNTRAYFATLQFK